MAMVTAGTASGTADAEKATAGTNRGTAGTEVTQLVHIVKQEQENAERATDYSIMGINGGTSGTDSGRAGTDSGTAGGTAGTPSTKSRNRRMSK